MLVEHENQKRYEMAYGFGVTRYALSTACKVYIGILFCPSLKHNGIRSPLVVAMPAAIQGHDKAPEVGLALDHFPMFSNTE